MYYPHMPGKGVVSTESLVLNTKYTTDLLLLWIMDGVFMSREIIWPTEGCIARLASCRVDAFAFVLASLTADTYGILVGKLMSLQLSSRPKAAVAAIICACVATRIYESRNVSWLLHVRVVVLHSALIC